MGGSLSILIDERYCTLGQLLVNFGVQRSAFSGKPEAGRLSANA
jgi:hypothetical protein